MDYTVSQTPHVSCAQRFQQVRRFSEELCEPLEPEDCVIQSMPDVSPTRWHLAHTTWFFETFVLGPDHRRFHPAFEQLFNSYYNSVGRQFPRPRRGLLSRPTMKEVWQYRRAVEEAVLPVIEQAELEENSRLLHIVELGLHHEQQHQELMLTDIKHVFSCNPLYPSYCPASPPAEESSAPQTWTSYRGGIFEIGHQEDDFCFDNELPRHRALLHDYELASRLATNGEYLQFMEEGGYRRPELWLSLGWNWVQSEQASAPLYWVQQESGWHEFSLLGLNVLNLHQPVCHLNYFEADAFARWSGARLPTEAEWERGAANAPVQGSFADGRSWRPAAATAVTNQFFGELWQWTSSSYSPYPGYRAPAGALGEYNGKFMCNQYVLRGASCATSRSHARLTYRNFFPPEARWQFTGVRLAR